MINTDFDPVFCSLKPNDLVGGAAPGARFDEQTFHKGGLCLESMGFEMHIPNDLNASSNFCLPMGVQVTLNAGRACLEWGGMSI